MMRSRWSGTDEELVDAIRVAVSESEPPDGIVQQARAAFSLRNVVAQIAELDFDSAIDDDDLARVRATFGSRRLSFRTPALSLTIDIRDRPRRIVGRIEPPTPMTIVLRQPPAEWTVTTDEHGYFIFEQVAAGAASLRCWTPEGQSDVETEWVTL